MKFLQSFVSAVTVAVVLVTGSVSVKAAGDNKTTTSTPQTQSQPIDTTPDSQLDTPQPEAPASPQDTPSQQASPAAPASSSQSNLNNQTSAPNYQSNTQFQSSALNFNNSCGTQIIAKTGGNTTGIADWSVGVSWNINNPCTPQPKQENITCQQHRVNAMQVILTSLRQDPKNPKSMPSPSELRAYLDTICVLN